MVAAVEDELVFRAPSAIVVEVAVVASIDIVVKVTDGELKMKLKIKKSDSLVLVDWYVIERAEHDGRTWMEREGSNGPDERGPQVLRVCCSSRFSDADVEGTKEEMLGIAGAIEQRSRFRSYRCAVRVEGQQAFFCSPRNSEREGACSLEEADALAQLIRETLADDEP